MRFLQKSLPFIVIFLLGAGSAVALDSLALHVKIDPTAHQVREGGGTYTNPLLECDVGAGSINAPKVRFERELEQKVAVVEKRDTVSEVAVYYRDLNNGPAFGIRENEGFFPASLLKVPVLISFLKRSESDDTLLNRQILFTRPNASAVNQIIKPEVKLEDKQTYSVWGLLEDMIVYSDNDALTTLYPLIPSREYDELYNRLGIKGVNLDDVRTTLTVVDYSTFFRVLFNASYLSQASSEKVLELLTRTVFMDGLRAGVPSEVRVAHKFGERDLGDGYYQLHDCGIVYVPSKPYLICIMTRGTSQEDLKAALRDISKFTYEQVTK